MIDFSPTHAPTAVLVLASGDVFYGQGIGHIGSAVGEVCFNTAITGYQEILTDPSYAAQIVCFTFPHIGNTCLLYTSPSPRDLSTSRMPSSA